MSKSKRFSRSPQKRANKRSNMATTRTLYDKQFAIDGLRNVAKYANEQVQAEVETTLRMMEKPIARKDFYEAFGCAYAALEACVPERTAQFLNEVKLLRTRDVRREKDHRAAEIMIEMSGMM